MNIKLKAPLSQEISKEYSNFMKAINLVPSDKFFDRIFDGTGGLVSLSNILAYQIGWGELLIHWYEEGIKGKKVEMPGLGFKTWDYLGIANYFYDKYKDFSKSQLENHFHNIVIRIIEITEHEFLLGNLDATNIWDWCALKSGKAWPFSKWIRVNTIAPYKRARLIIKGIKWHCK